MCLLSVIFHRQLAIVETSHKQIQLQRSETGKNIRSKGFFLWVNFLVKPKMTHYSFLSSIVDPSGFLVLMKLEVVLLTEDIS